MIEIHDLEWKVQRYKDLAYKKKLTKQDRKEIARLERSLDRRGVQYDELKEVVRVRRLVRVSRSMM